MSKSKKQPNWNTVMTEVEVTSVLNWFNHNQTTRFAKKEFVRYLKEKQLCDKKYLKKDFDIIATDGFIASLLLQGYTLPEKSLTYFNKGVSECFSWTRRMSVSWEFGSEERLGTRQRLRENAMDDVTAR